MKNKTIKSIILVSILVLPSIIFFINIKNIPHILFISCCYLVVAVSRLVEHSITIIKKDNDNNYIDLFLSNCFYLSTLALSFWVIVWWIVWI